MNIPNMLSIFRLVLVPVFIVTYFQMHYYALGVFALASLTDLLDGYIARRYNLVTRIGTILDPLADKLMQLSVLLCLFFSGLFPLWALLILLVKELLMLIGSMLLYRRGVVKASNIFGKAATVIVSACIVVILIAGSSLGGIVNLLAAIAAGAAVTALISYWIIFLAAVRERKEH